jgi:hypothetical protein
MSDVEYIKSFLKIYTDFPRKVRNQPVVSPAACIIPITIYISGFLILRHLPTFPQPVTLGGRDHQPDPSPSDHYYTNLSQQENRRYRRARCSGLSLRPRDRAQAWRRLRASAQTRETSWRVRLRFIRERVRPGTSDSLLRQT